MGQRHRALDTLAGLGHSYSATIRELGYPSETCLRDWWADHEADGRTVEGTYHGEPKCDEGRRLRAVEHYLAHGRNASGTMRELGYPGDRRLLARWVNGLAPREHRVSAGGPRRVPRPLAAMIAGAVALELRLKIDVLRATRDLAKEDAGTDPKRLANAEKALAIDTLKPKRGLGELLAALDIAKSSCEYARAAAARLEADARAAAARLEADARATAREAVVASLEASGATHGYRRVLADVNAARPPGERAGEWTVRAVMREEGLVARVPARRRHSSYAGEVYPSPIIDCLDGRTVAWPRSVAPDAELANSSLRAACAQLGEGERPIVHGGRGGHYRWNEGVRICEERGLVRSMSRKGRGPDNARAEGLFGCLKVEFFHGRDWRGITVGEFEAMLDAYMGWYRDERPKSDLGYRSPMQYRRDLGLIP